MTLNEVLKISPAMHLIPIIFVLISSIVVAKRHRTSHWDYLVFAQQWPTSSCISQKQHQCKVPSYVTSWTVHGIWPSSKQSYPSYCNRSLTFNETAIKSIENQLLIVWPNLFTTETTDSFWKHEWLKHGTCAISLPQLDTELKYFSEAIKAHNLYNILDFLKDDNITPDGQTTYSLDHFRTAIESKTKKRAAFQCKKVKGFDFPLILTTFICLDKSFSLIDCSKKDEDCKSFVTYPPPITEKFQYIHFSQLHKYVDFLPVTCYVIAGAMFLAVVVIIAWFLSSFKRSSRDKKYTIFTNKECS